MRSTVLDFALLVGTCASLQMGAVRPVRLRAMSAATVEAELEECVAESVSWIVAHGGLPAEAASFLRKCLRRCRVLGRWIKKCMRTVRGFLQNTLDRSQIGDSMETNTRLTSCDDEGWYSCAIRGAFLLQHGTMMRDACVRRVCDASRIRALFLREAVGEKKTVVGKRLRTRRDARTSVGEPV